MSHGGHDQESSHTFSSSNHDGRLDASSSVFKRVRRIALSFLLLTPLCCFSWAGLGRLGLVFRVNSFVLFSEEVGQFADVLVKFLGVFLGLNLLAQPYETCSFLGGHLTGLPRSGRRNSMTAALSSGRLSCGQTFGIGLDG